MKNDVTNSGESCSPRKKIRNDVILAAVLLLLAAAVFLIFYFGGTRGTYVTVTVNGEEYGRYPIAENTEVRIENPQDASYVNILTIKDGEAYMSEANCRDGICTSHAPVKITGESIVCLPHKVVITVGGEDPGVDMVG